jgi:lysophospholipase L1-like esterase
MDPMKPLRRITSFLAAAIWSRRRLAAAAALATAMTGVTTVVLPASPAAAASAEYVTMGDSLSSGEGTYGTYLSGSDTATNKCHRSPASYAAQYMQQNSVNSYQLTNVACSGAGVNEIIYFANPNKGGIPDSGQVAQDLTLTSSTRLVTLTIGINDLDLIGFATKCYLLADKSQEDTCFNGIPKDTGYLFNLSVLGGALDSAYQAIRSHAPNATVAVLAYPQIYPATYSGDCQKFPFSNFALVTSPNMLKTARGLVQTLNTKIATEVAKFPGFIFVDQAENALAGHDVCAGTPWVNQIMGLTAFNQTNPDDESLHPTTSGYQAIAARAT